MYDKLDWLLVLIPALPLAAAIVCGLLGPRLLRGQSHLPVVAAFLVSFVCSVMLLGEVHSRQQASAANEPGAVVGYEHLVRLWTWSLVDNAWLVEDQNGDAVWRSFDIDVTLRADALTAVMLCMVTFVSLLVAVFAAGYMHGDRGYWRFFAYVALFVFSMAMLVSVSNFVMLFVFWEAVGVCSYLLIGHWYEKPEAAAAGKKAFLVNRVGDFAFTLALFLIWTTYGTLNFHDTLDDGRFRPTEVAAAVQQEGPEAAGLEPGVLGQSRIRGDDYIIGPHGQWMVTLICFLLMIGACGKSAQFPLHVWLPDAMEGPTPVSALIHAATMVTAGVYMVARCTPLFMASPDAQLLVACIGGFTALLAALIAMTQFDLKRVLAYSTVSQLGYMFLALGTGTLAGVTAGMFHLFTHAFFKALLFLGAGSVMHAMGNVIDMRRFGGLRKIMPYTHATFLIGCLALAGVAPLAGFWSKDGVLAAVEGKSHALEDVLRQRHAGGGDLYDDDLYDQLHPAYVTPEEFRELRANLYAQMTDEQLERNAWLYQLLYIVGILTAFLTAFYTFRAFFMTFYGEERIPSEAQGHAHESPRSMLGPLVVLAGCALVVGLIVDQIWLGRGHLFGEFLEHTPSLAAGGVWATAVPHKFHLDIAAIATLVALSGIVVALFLYLGERREVDWLRYVLDFQWLQRMTDVASVARLRELRWVDATYRGAQAVKLGWLASLAGRIVLLVVLLLAAPLLLGLFFTPYRLSQNKFYFDEIYQWLIVQPLRFGAWLMYAFDRWIVDAAVNGVGRIPVALGTLMRALQMGLVQFYALAMILGILVLVVARLFMMAE